MPGGALHKIANSFVILAFPLSSDKTQAREFARSYHPRTGRSFRSYALERDRRGWEK
jgi:hypothetical protein